MRIVSLLPSATEIVCALGLEEHLVGVTHECDFPLSVAGLPAVTRTVIPHNSTSAEIDTLVRERLKTQTALYTLDMPTLERLRPDMIVTQALCDVCAVAEEEVRTAACSLPGLPTVVNLEPMSLDDVFATLLMVGRAAGCEARARRVVGSLRRRVWKVAQRSTFIPIVDCPRVAFLEWIDPPFNAGHWTPTLIELAGGIDVLGNSGQPSHPVSWEQVLEVRPDVLFIACCGYSAGRAMTDLAWLESRAGWLDLPCVRSERVYFADGSSYFNRPGPRLVDSLEILAHALHPRIHPLPDYLPAAMSLCSRKAGV